MRRFGPPGECEKGVWLNEGMGGMSKKKKKKSSAACLCRPGPSQTLWGVRVCVCRGAAGMRSGSYYLWRARLLTQGYFRRMSTPPLSSRSSSPSASRKCHLS